MTNFGSPRRSILFTIVPIFIGIAAVVTIGLFIAQIVAGAWLVQHPADAGNWIRDVVAPVIQEIKK